MGKYIILIVKTKGGLFLLVILGLKNVNNLKGFILLPSHSVKTGAAVSKGLHPVCKLGVQNLPPNCTPGSRGGSCSPQLPPSARKSRDFLVTCAPPFPWKGLQEQNGGLEIKPQNLK